jgi:hypothetical protein
MRQALAHVDYRLGDPNLSRQGRTYADLFQMRVDLVGALNRSYYHTLTLRAQEASTAQGTNFYGHRPVVMNQDRSVTERFPGKWGPDAEVTYFPDGSVMRDEPTLIGIDQPVRRRPDGTIWHRPPEAEPVALPTTGSIPRAIGIAALRERQKRNALPDLYNDRAVLSHTLAAWHRDYARWHGHQESPRANAEMVANGQRTYEALAAAQQTALEAGDTRAAQWFNTTANQTLYQSLIGRVNLLGGDFHPRVDSDSGAVISGIPINGSDLNVTWRLYPDGSAVVMQPVGVRADGSTIYGPTTTRYAANGTTF